jgi:hypothetical protein
MVCYLSFAIASGFIGASIMTMLSTHKKLLSDNFMNTLTPSQKQIYTEITQERYDLYIQGQIIALIVGCMYLYYAKIMKLSCPQSVGTFLLLVTSIQYFYYTMAPKSKWMVDYLTTPESMKEWLVIYKYMKRQYHLGFIFGLVGYALIAYAFTKKQ